MKISFFYDLAYPFSKGGAEKRIYDFASYLAQYHKVEIVSSKLWDGGDNYACDGMNYVGISKNFCLYDKKGKRRIAPSILFGVRTFFFVLKTDSDILDFEVFPYFPIIFAKTAVFFKKKKPKIIGNWCECMGPISWKNYSKSLWFLGVSLEKLAKSSSDSYLAISEFTQERMVEYLGINRERISVIYPALIDCDKIDKIKVPLKKKYHIIYFGRLIQHKQVDRIIKLVARLKKDGVSTKTLIIGNGPEEIGLKKMTRSYNLIDDIEFLNFINDYGEFIEKIKSAKLMVFPSEREGFGISVIEANACGLPVLVLDSPDNATKELIRNGQNGYLCRNIEELLSKVTYLIDPVNEKEFHQMSLFSQICAKKYDKKVTEKKITDFYSSISR